MNRPIAGYLFLATALTVMSQAQTANNLNQWTWRNPLPQGNTLKDVGWNGSVAVAVGEGGTILSCTDGTNWVRRVSSTTANLGKIIWSGTKFAVVGGGPVLLSPDGIVWATVDRGPGGSLRGLAWNGIQFVAVGSLGNIVTSPDGVTWIARTSGVSSQLESVVWGGDQFVAVGWNGAILTSPDGVVWMVRVSGTTGILFGVTSTGNQYVAVGGSGVFTSGDGVTWTNSNSALTSIQGVNWIGGQLFAVGGYGGIWTSSDAATWTSRKSGGISAFMSVASTGSQYMAVGYAGLLATSPTGAVWTNQSIGNADTKALFKLVWSGSQFVAVGPNGETATSGDGFTWTNRSVGTADWFRSVVLGAGQLVAVGEGASGASVWVSTDGGTWTNRPTGLSGSLMNILWDGVRFLAVGTGGMIVTSANGASWTNQASGTTNHLRACTWSGSQYVAVGDEGTIVSSSDGILWNIRRTAAGEQFTGVTWGEGQFVAIVGSGGATRILTSPNGITWTNRTPTGASQWNLLDITWTGSDYVAVGGLGLLVTSPDGVSWTTRDSGSANTLWGVAGNGRQVVAVGYLGTVVGAFLQSPPAISIPPANITIVSNDHAQLRVSATGTGTLSYQWFQGLSGDTSIPISSATSATFTTPLLTFTTSYWVRIVDGNGNVTNSPAATVTVSATSPLTVSQSVMGHGYMAGGAVTVTNTIAYIGTAPSRIDWATLLPTGWKYIGSGGTEGAARPVYKSADLLEWSWTTVPASPVEFTYTISVPAGSTADQVIAALVTSLQAGTNFQTMAKPDPLVLRSASLHSADSNRDGRISLLELTRVIELYNYRSGTTRTGQYKVKAGTEDGFEAGP